MDTKLAKQVLQALKNARRYVEGAYECAFPDYQENAEVLQDVDDAIRAMEQLCD